MVALEGFAQKERHRKKVPEIWEWGYKIGSRQYDILEKICNPFKKRGFCTIHDMGGKRALEPRYLDPKGDGIGAHAFKFLLARDMVRVARILRRDAPYVSLRTHAENLFPAVFIYSHECHFITKYGEKVPGIDAVATISLDDLKKIQPEFDDKLVDRFDDKLVDRVARLEITDTTPIDIAKLTFQEAISPGIVKRKRRKRSLIQDELRDLLLREADYSCEECGAKLEDGATLEVDHIVPVSKRGTDDYENLQVLCATCNRKKGASL